jgi:hypothetical protein
LLVHFVDGGCAYASFEGRTDHVKATASRNLYRWY